MNKKCKRNVKRNEKNVKRNDNKCKKNMECGGSCSGAFSCYSGGKYVETRFDDSNDI